MKQWKVAKPYLTVQGGLLEGPVHSTSRQEVQFVDINEKFLYTFNPSDGQLQKVKVRDAVAVMANIQGSSKDVIVGAKYGFAKLDKATGNMEYIRKFWNSRDHHSRSERMRSNDGAVDSHGRFWVGTMVDHRLEPGPEPEGIMFRLDPDLSLHRMMHNLGTPNGMGWNSKDDTMFWTDSVDQNIYAFDFNAVTGSISNKRIFYHVDIGPGINPDGLVVDTEDCVWTAIWGGGKVLKISPQGNVIGEVLVPTSLVTCPAFIGTQLLIATARDPHVKEVGVRRGGDIYLLDVGVAGAPTNEFRFETSPLIQEL